MPAFAATRSEYLTGRAYARSRPLDLILTVDCAGMATTGRGGANTSIPTIRGGAGMATTGRGGVGMATTGLL